MLFWYWVRERHNIYASMRPRGQTPRMRHPMLMGIHQIIHASMRPRGQTPRMPATGISSSFIHSCFNEAAGADPADARGAATSSSTTRRRFNEAAGADPADARAEFVKDQLCYTCFNEAAGADPADANPRNVVPVRDPLASMRPRGQTPRMPGG